MLCETLEEEKVDLEVDPFLNDPILSILASMPQLAEPEIPHLGRKEKVFGIEVGTPDLGSGYAMIPAGCFDFQILWVEPYRRHQAFMRVQIVLTEVRKVFRKWFPDRFSMSCVASELLLSGFRDVLVHSECTVFRNDEVLIYHDIVDGQGRTGISWYTKASS